MDPNAHIRPEFIAQVIETKDGRTLTGLLAEENSSSLTLLDAKNQRLVLAKDKIETMPSSSLSSPSTISLISLRVKGSGEGSQGISMQVSLIWSAFNSD